jgi:CheY-like chemotaxis protein
MRSAGVSAWTQVPIGHRELFDALAIAMAPRATNAPPRPAEKPVTAPEVQTALDPSALRLLLAEDNFLNMKLTMSQLKKLGYSADLAANGREVLEAVSRREYDVILMDCQMPILDGYDATLEIRRMEKSGGRPRHWIIAMTANALEGDREKCLAAGMDDYLAKPTHQEELSRALQAGGSRVRR